MPLGIYPRVKKRSWKLSKEIRERMKGTLNRQEHWFKLGHKNSQEVRDKISQGLKGKLPKKWKTRGSSYRKFL